MAITKSWDREVALKLTAEPARLDRRRDWLWLAGASFLIACGLALVCIAKLQQLPAPGHAVDLNAISSPQELLPWLASYTDPAERNDAAQAIFGYLETHRPVPNVGALARIRVGTKSL